MSSISSCVDMDVDGPVNGSGTLKRCSSAPMINEGNSVMTAAPSSTSVRDQQSFNLFGGSTQTRTRRFSASFSPVSGSSVASGLRLTPRITQIRQEEHADVSNLRELAHEREIHHAMQISQSWEDLSLMNESQQCVNDAPNKPSSKMGPLHVSLPPYGVLACNSPSPTRLGSPGFQSPTRASRTFVRRSASPVLRPSPLGVKRKLDDERVEYYVSPRAKRFHSHSASSERLSGAAGLLTTTPGSLSSVGTPESLSSADSPGFSFRNVDSPSPRAMPPEPMVVAKTDHDMNHSLS